MLAAVLFSACLTTLVQAAPDVPPTLDNSNSWAFYPPPDQFKDNALLDLRSLNEKVAGQNGYLRLSEDGNSFVLGDGTPMRVWGVDSEAALRPDDMDAHYRFLAKLGVNVVRLQFTICDTKKGAAITDVNERAIDQVQRSVATAKKYGIYTMPTPYWAMITAPESWGLEGVSNQSPWGLLFFNKKLQDAYKVWMKELLTRPNPYDNGLPLAKEPAMSMFEIQDEDTLFFYTMQRLPDAQSRILDTQYGEWLVKKYGSLEKAKAAWDGAGQPGDDFAAGVVSMIDPKSMAWQMTQPQPDGTGKRMHDQVEFLAKLQYGFYADMGDYFRNTLGCQTLINPSNWRTADPVLLDDIERWTYTSGEVSGVDRYTGVIHTGQNNGYRIDPGHEFINQPVVRAPLSYPGADKLTVGIPFLVIETSWVNPARYQAAGPFMEAAYNSLTGLDGWLWFTADATTWNVDPRRKFWDVIPGNQAGYAIAKWTISVPQLMGMFPANALAFRKGYIEQAKEPAVHEERSMENLWDRTVPIISEAGKYDPNRDQGEFAPASTIKQQVDPLAFMVGPVEIKYGGDPAKSHVIDLKPYIDKTNEVVRSMTGQIALDYKKGVCTVDSPRYQGAAGFLKDGGGKYDFKDVSITSSNEYAAVTVVPMDGDPLATSHEVLVQVGTVARLTDWKVEPTTLIANERAIDGYKIITTGRPPLRVANTEVTLTITNPNLTKATLLDPSGYAVKDVPAKTAGGKLTIELPKDTMYLILR